MSFALVYLIRRAVLRIEGFMRHWYGDGTRAMVHGLVSTLESMDRTVAFGVTVRHFFEPLYQDWSIVGRIIGIIFRSIRAVIGVVLYIMWGGVWAAMLVVWWAIPFVLLLYGIRVL